MFSNKAYHEQRGGSSKAGASAARCNVNRCGVQGEDTEKSPVGLHFYQIAGVVNAIQTGGIPNAYADVGGFFDQGQDISIIIRKENVTF